MQGRVNCSSLLAGVSNKNSYQEKVREMGGSRVRIAKTLVSTLLGVALLGGAMPALAQQAEITRATALMNESKPADAFALLYPLEDKYAGNQEYDYLLGISALDSGKSDIATLAFERVLAVNPNFAGARLDLARAYFQLGDLTRSKSEFLGVQSQNPPAAARETVSRYLEAIEKVEESRKRSLRAYVEFSIGLDSNVNNSTSQSTIAVPALGNLTFTLNPSNVSVVDNFSTIGFGGEYTREISPGTGVFVGADVRKRMNFTEDNFDTENHDLRGGVSIGQPSNQLRVTGTGGRYQLDGALNRFANGIGADYRYNLTPATQFNAFSQYSRTRFVNLGVNNFNQSTSGLGGLQVFADGRGAIFGSYFFGEERDTDGRADGGKKFSGVRLGGQWMLNEGMDVFGFMSLQSGNYGRQNGTFLVNRQDDTQDVVLGMNWRFAKDWTFREQILSTRNKSNINLFTFDRVEVSFSVRRDFSF